MPSSLDEDDIAYGGSDDAKIATMVGARLVNQILEEACTVISTTENIGWPWSCVPSVYKDLKTGKAGAPGRESLSEYLQGDNEIVNETREHSNVMATSTPQKGENMKIKTENNFIGQGDEEIFVPLEERSISPTMYINQLFDMSVVSDGNKDEEDIIQDKSEVIIQEDEELPSAVYDIMEMLFRSVVGSDTEEQADVIEIPLEEVNISDSEEIDVEKYIEINEINDKEVITIEELSDAEEAAMKDKIREIHYSFIQEAYDSCGLDTVHCFLDQNDEDSMEDYEAVNANVDIQRDCGDFQEATGPCIKAKSNEEDKEDKREAARYESAYLSLNRDCEQFSDDGDPVLQDPKEPMQEVELFPSSDDDKSSICREEEARQKLAATSAVSGASGSRKSRASLASRCRTQGARLLSCLRGWWRRKTPGKRKDAKTGGSILGVCPLSPDARRRAASMLDQRELYSPKSGHAWKFNTVNETVIKSTRWKDYTYELAEKSSDEFC